LTTIFAQFPIWEIDLVSRFGKSYFDGVQIVSRSTLEAFWELHCDAETPLRAWYAAVAKAVWTRPADVRAQFGTADFVGDNRVIFDIGGNKYRLVVHVSYRFRALLVKFVGTHADYDDIDPETV
jgi:mRNA interferase HigB